MSTRVTELRSAEDFDSKLTDLEKMVYLLAREISSGFLADGIYKFEFNFLKKGEALSTFNIKHGVETNPEVYDKFLEAIKDRAR